MNVLGLLASDSSLRLNVVRYLKADCVVYGLSHKLESSI